MDPRIKSGGDEGGRVRLREVGMAPLRAKETRASPPHQPIWMPPLPATLPSLNPKPTPPLTMT
jgi:hypothetical protein